MSVDATANRLRYESDAAASRENKYSESQLTEGLKETANTVNRLMLTLLALALFSLLAVGQPDAYLLNPAATISVPSVGAASAKALLVVGPLLLIGVRIYLQIYIRHWTYLDAIANDQTARRAAVVSPMRHPLLKIMAGLVLYLLVPVTLFIFTWKAMLIPKWWGYGLLIVSPFVLAVHLLQNKPMGRLGWVKAMGLTAVLIATVAYFCERTEAFRRNFDLRFEKLGLTDLADQDLRNADLRQAELNGADLSGARLGNANLHRAELKHTTLREAELNGADLSEAKLTGANLIKAKLNGANLTVADLDEATLFRAQLKGAYLVGASLRKAILRGAQLEGAQLQKANLNAARLERTNLNEARLDEAQLKKAILFEAQLNRANLSKARLDGADLGGAQFEDAILDRAHLQGANLRGARLQGASLFRTQLQGANLSDARLQGADLSEAQLQGANLSRADLSKTDLSCANFKGVTGLNSAVVATACFQPRTGDKLQDESRGPPINLPGGIKIPPCKTEKEKIELH